MGMYNDPEYFDKESRKMRRVLTHIGAFFAAIVTYAIVFTIVYFALSLLGEVPVLRFFLFERGDVFWTRSGLSPSLAVIAAAGVSEAISGTARPVTLFGALYYISAIVLMALAGSLSGEMLIQDVFTAVICLWQYKTSPSLKDAKIAMMNKSRAE